MLSHHVVHQCDILKPGSIKRKTCRTDRPIKFAVCASRNVHYCHCGRWSVAVWPYCALLAPGIDVFDVAIGVVKLKDS